jgi:hypothetical protein
MNIVKKQNIAIVVITFVTIICLLIFLLPSELYADSVPYETGDTGPSGGLIFYVDGSYCLEAAPSDLVSDSVWSNVTDTSVATSTAIGTGQSNTTNIVNQAGHTTSAAKLCDEYSITSNGIVYDDWFLPSRYEIQEMWVNLHLQSLGGFNNEYYWSSSEDDGVIWGTADITKAYVFKFSGWIGVDQKNTSYQVRPARAFIGMKEVSDINKIRVSDTNKIKNSEAEETTPWVRGDRDMVCYQVCINDDGCFEFVFWYEYKDNNWVKIYDTNGNEVFSINMKYGKASFEACELPDGMFTVKTFHNDMTIPLQEFTIGKP